MENLDKGDFLLVIENLSKAKAFYIQGKRFAQCADRSMGEITQDGSIKIVGGKYNMLSAPLMVNTAFACEVFLKGLLIAHGVDYKKLLKQRKGHGLKALYDLLPKEEYKEFLRVPNKDTFDEKLEAHANDFVNWRYYMENPGEYRMEPSFTWILMHNLQTLLEEVLMLTRN